MKSYIKRHTDLYLQILFITSLAFAPIAGVGYAEAAEIVSPAITSSLSASLETNEGTPVYLYIPSIKLFSYIEGVGVTKTGNMDVPSGRTDHVGWYDKGIVPGNVGTAVIDAHNTAAFKSLNKVPVGENVYVFTSTGKWLHFAVTQAHTYAVENLSPYTLFAPTNTRQINLITCAGTLLGNGEATHRLIVSAELV